MSLPLRTVKGTPDGGRFATNPQAEAIGVELQIPAASMEFAAEQGVREIAALAVPGWQVRAWDANTVLLSSDEEDFLITEEETGVYVLTADFTDQQEHYPSWIAAAQGAGAVAETIAQAKPQYEHFDPASGRKVEMQTMPKTRSGRGSKTPATGWYYADDDEPMAGCTPWSGFPANGQLELAVRRETRPAPAELSGAAESDQYLAPSATSGAVEERARQARWDFVMEQERDSENLVGNHVGSLVPGAVSWSAGTQSSDGEDWRYSDAEIYATMPDGSQVPVDLQWPDNEQTLQDMRSEINRGLQELTDAQGPLSEDDCHDAPIRGSR